MRPPAFTISLSPETKRPCHYSAAEQEDGGAFFGVPVQNFMGWYLTVFIFLALFSWYQSKQPVGETPIRHFWAQAIVMYFLLGLRYPLLYAR
jgi:uncharacterized membrane protein